MTFLPSTLRTLLTLLLAGCAWLAQAAEPSVSSGFSQSVAQVGESLQFQVKIDGARQGGQPPDVSLDGLNVRYLGPSQSTSMRYENGRMTTSSHVIHVYSVQPEREGVFTVPALTVLVDGRALRTEPATLRVAADANRTSNVPRAQGTLEIVIPKQTAYVGELIPVEIRLSIDAQIRWDTQAMPELTGDGFTKQKMPEPRRERGRKDGREMDVRVFRTAITPSKAGKLKLGPAEVPYVAVVPRAQSPRQRRGSLFDMFGDEVFGDPMFSQQQQFRARADAVEIDVKPLPAAGRPESFSGAVGQFTFTAEGSPRQVKVGDPVTMKLVVNGRGNFDRIEAPVLLDSTGWRPYPPAAKFDPEDELTGRGTKTFEMAVIPETKQTALPVFEFSYFDPATAKYAALRSEAQPVVVEGAPAPPPPSPASTASSAFGAPSEAPAAAPLSDILGIRYDAAQGPTSFAPLYAQRGFWLAQLLPLALVLGLLGRRFLRSNPQAGRTTPWRQEKASLLGKLRRSDLAETEFFDVAARLVQLEVALATGREPGSVDAAMARDSLRVDDRTAERIEEIFSARAELLYAGGGAGEAHLPAEERRRFVTMLEQLAKGSPRG